MYYRLKLKKYKKQTKIQSNEVGVKKDIWKALVKDALKEGLEDFDPAVVKRLLVSCALRLA